ncbi:hypothetical protein [uncultured Azohydromonas sp.]|jgi:hypothetical protein|uniref:hypothetical protein n=1 Tax=uncultured Azohydromonas sp. TaxID=487342 RepID=UPI00260E6E11|nr:hypothetical protein [uncultured Azohydromonas sp.]
MDKDVITTEERYSRAITSSHLRAGDAASDVDVLIAAGAMRDELGPLLYRLRVELDGVRGEQLLVQQRQREVQAAIKVSMALVQREMRRGPPRAAEDLEVLLRRQQQLHGEERVAYAKALQQLRSLPAARDALGRWAVVEATRRYFMRPDSVVVAITGQVLRTFLEPRCQSCHGLGTKGGNGKPLQVCRWCSGTGRAQEALGRDDVERNFATYLLAEMERRFSFVDADMRHHLRGRNLRG